MTVDPPELFDEYAYFSSLLDHDGGARRGDRGSHGRQSAASAPRSLVVEIASNDGYLLAALRARAACPCSASSPRATWRQAAARTGRRRPSASSSATTLADELRIERQAGRRAARQQRAGARARPERVRRGASAACSPTTASPSIETPYVRDLVERLEFDTIYHEHLFYYSLTSLDRLFRRNGCASSTSSASRSTAARLRVFAAPASAHAEPTAAVAAMLEEEDRLGLATRDYFQDFADRVAALEGQLLALLAIPEGAGAPHRRVRRRRQGHGAAERLRHRHRAHRLRRRPQPVQAGPLHAGRAHPDRRARAAARPTCPTTCCCWPGTSPTRSLDQQEEYRDRGGRFIVPGPGAGGDRGDRRRAGRAAAAASPTSAAP